MYKAQLGIVSGNTDKLIKVCEDIKLKDKTFKYEIVAPFIPFEGRFENVLIIYDDDEKGVSERAGWFKNKMRDAKVSDFFLVKECRDLEYLRKHLM